MDAVGSRCLERNELSDPLGCTISYLKVASKARRFGNRQAILPEAGKVKFNGFLQPLLNLFPIPPGSNAPRQIGDIGGVSGIGLLIDDRVSHDLPRSPLGILDPCLPPDALEGANLEILIPMTSDCHTTGLCRVLELTVISFGNDTPPAVLLQYSDHLSHLHRARSPTLQYCTHGCIFSMVNQTETGCDDDPVSRVQSRPRYV